MTNNNHKYAIDIAAALGKGWSYDRKRSSDGDGNLWATATILGPDGAQLGLSKPTYPASDRGKVEIRGRDGLVDSEGKPFSVYGTKSQAIKVAESRGAAVIAAEIKRRLLPEYLATLAHVQDRLAKRNAHIAKEAAMIKLVARELGAAISTRSPDRLSGEIPSTEISFSANVGTESTSLELRYLTIAQLRAVVKALKVEAESRVAS